MSHPPQTFQQVRRAKGVTSRAIAEAANIPLREEYLYELGAPTTPETKGKIIAAFSTLTGHPYQISDFEPEVSIEEQPTLVSQKHVLHPVPKSHHPVSDEEEHGHE